jgi:hypothetical protein
MENLYIEVVDGVIINHPIFESNLIQVFPDIALNDHDKYIPFERVPQPEIGLFQINEGVTYEFDGPNKVKDVWKIRDMTDEEKQARIEQVRAMKPYPSWTFDETTLTWSAPVPYPGVMPTSSDHAQTITVFYNWDENTLSWKEITSESPAV